MDVPVYDEGERAHAIEDAKLKPIDPTLDSSEFRKIAINEVFSFSFIRAELEKFLFTFYCILSLSEKCTTLFTRWLYIKWRWEFLKTWHTFTVSRPVYPHALSALKQTT